MNAPLPEHLRRALETVTLDDKYALAQGRAFMSGVQALVRLPMLQQQRDAAAGLRTAGFIFCAVQEYFAVKSRLLLIQLSCRNNQ